MCARENCKHKTGQSKKFTSVIFDLLGEKTPLNRYAPQFAITAGGLISNNILKLPSLVFFSLQISCKQHTRQWRQMSVLPPPPIRSVLQWQYF